MNKKIAITGLSLLFITNMTWALDETDPTMSQTRIQLQSQMQSMSGADRALYQELNGSGEGNGNMNRKGNGSGNGSGDKKRLRSGQGNGTDNGSGSINRLRQSDGGYGSGYGSRRGGGQRHL